MRVNNFLTFSIATALTACTHAAPEIQLITRVDALTLKLSPDALANVKTAKVTSGDFPDSISVMGKIGIPENKTTTIPARIAGRIDAVYVSSGETVKVGQPLVSLYSADFVIAREEYAQTLNQVRANPGDEESKHYLALSRQKLKTLGMGGSDVDRIGGAGAGSDNVTIRASRAGAIIDKKATVGGMVNPGDTLFTIGDMSEVWFTGDIYPEDLAKVHKDQRVTIAGESGSAPASGKVSFISPVVDPTTRTIKIRAVMENTGLTLRADMYMRANLVLSERKALLIPKEALLRDQEKIFVFLSDDGKTFRKTDVKTSGETGNLIAVREGARENQIVVTEGASLLDNALNEEQP
ncbi:MAG: efflux RND transporter periplasmic adaptor subunit [Cryobacterium sp.]|nr:efflux RND transporter periplasmic adaptor subunit [Oligoflexia bacterium]